MLTAGNSNGRHFPENLVDESGDYNYEEYSHDPSEAKFLSLTKELGNNFSFISKQSSMAAEPNY